MAAVAGTSGGGGSGIIPLTGSQEFAQSVLRDPNMTQPAVSSSSTQAPISGSTGNAGTSGGNSGTAASTTVFPSSASTSSITAPPVTMTVTAPVAAAPAPKKFFFRRRTERLDWRKLSKVDLHRIVTEVDISALQDNVEHITFADIGDGTSCVRVRCDCPFSTLPVINPCVSVCACAAVCFFCV
jgi:hypothetical protein